MATNTREARKEALKKRDIYFNNYMSQFCILFNESVEIENLPSDLPKRYLLRVLRNKGGIAYDKITKLYLPYVEKGIDVYGLPQEYTLIGFNGFVVSRKSEEVVILRANDLRYPIVEYFEQQIYKLVDLDLAIEQNLDSIKTCSIAEVSDESQLLSLANEYQAKRIGATVIFKNKKALTGSEIKVSKTEAQYLVDKLLENRKKILNETLSSIGINMPNVDKRERVQDNEIRASQGFALDSLNALINTFNHDAEIGGLSIRLKGKTSLYNQDELETKIKEKELKGE